MKDPKVNVVLVEDDEDDYVLTRSLLDELTEGRFELKWVSEYDGALEAMRDSAGDVYLVDYRLGQRDGLELLREALAQGVQAPIILLTGQGTPEVDIEAMRSGAADYLVKGQIDSYLLDRAIRHAIERKDIEDRLRDSERRYRGIVEDQTELVCRFRPDRQLTFVNEAYCRYFGKTRDELIGTDVFAYLIPDEIAFIEANLEHLTPELPATPYYEHQITLPDGETRWQQWADRAIFDELGTFIEYQSVGRDVTQRRLAEEAEREQRVLAEALRDSAEFITQSLQLDEVLGRILDNVSRVSRYETAAITLLDGDMVYVARARGYAERGMADIEGRRWLAQSAPSFQYMMETGLPFIVTDTQTDIRWAPLTEADWQRSYLGVPIVSKGETIGFLNLEATQPNFFLPAHADRVIAFATQAGIAIENARLYEETRRSASRAQALARTASRLNADLEVDAVLETIVDETAQALRIENVCVHLYESSLDSFVLAASRGVPDGLLPRLQMLPRVSAPPRIWGDEDVFVVNDLVGFGNSPNYQLYLEYQLRTSAIAKLFRNQQLFGILSISSFGQPRVFTGDELALLKGLADQSVQAIANANLFAQTRRRVERLKALRDIDVAITSSFDVRVTFNILLEQVATQLHVDAVDILALNEHTHELDFLIGRGFRSSALQHTHLRLGKGYAGIVALERRLVHIVDLQADESLLQQSPSLLGEGFVSYFGVPLIAKGQVQGVLEVFHRQALHPDQEWIEFLETLGGQAAIAIDNAALFNSLQRTNVDLMLAYDATIEGWSHALDLRDKETEGHTQRVTNMTIRLAQAMNIAESEIIHIRRGALLHDIGKMGIPDGILLKPGPLTDEEWVIMRKHPVYAYEMLSPIQYLGPALDIPYCHHEKWDGTGYPRGLKGEQIPLSARIFAIVDVWDALSSDRPYRAAWPEAKVREHVLSLSGTHFDPHVVAAFSQLF